MSASKLARAYRITDGRSFRLKKFDPKDTASINSKERAVKLLEAGVRRLAELQDQFYAADRHSILLIFQAMDAAGKDSAIKHVMSGVNPQGCQVHSFKGPSAEELDHDFLWRCTQRLPERGRIGIFNRSYYEETLVVRVHPELLAKQKLPPGLVTKQVWKERFEDIRNLERHLVRNGTVVLKFFLHVSREEQRRRFLARLDDPAKTWKFSPNDVAERRHWGAYMDAYEDTIRNTATPDAPWFVVPADHKWFTRHVIAEAIIDSLESLDMRAPKMPKEEQQRLAAARAELTRKK